MNGHANLKFGGGAAESHLNPVVLVLMLIALALMLVLPRKYAVVPFLLGIFLTPFGQQIYVAGVHLFVPRILILFGCIRAVFAKISSHEEIASGGFNAIDTFFLLLAVISSLANVLLFLQTQALIYQGGVIWDTIGGYFLLRFLVRDEEDVLRVIKTFAVITCILSVTMLGEKLFDLNVFGFIGGEMRPLLRDGALRARGTFQGPIPAGTFAATFLCLFAWLWQSGKAGFLGIASIVGATIMVVTSASSTPLLAYLAAFMGLSMWPLRKKMRAIRWGILILLVSLHLVMKAPVWFLINHVDLIAGNSGYHRAELIDQCVKHFSDWWLMGVKSTAEWGWDMWDQANQFTAVASGSGLAALICFVLMISQGFGRIGSARKLVDGDRKKEWMLWLLGAALFSHVVAFFGISYNDQTVFSWFALLALISAATAPILATASVTKELPVPRFANARVGYTASTVSNSARGRVPS
jgi:hypothetical protein